MKSSTAFFLLLGALVDAKCYLPDGSAATKPEWAACSSDSSDPLSGICCGTNQTNPAGGLQSDGPTAETCLPNGVCQNDSTDKDGNHKFSYRRTYCTNADWNSGKCLNICKAADSGFSAMTPCDGTSTSERWCCGSNQNCCNPDNNLPVVSLAAKFGDGHSTVKSSATSKSSATDKPTSIPSSNAAPTPTTAVLLSGALPPSAASTSHAASPSPSSEAGLTTGAKIGIGLGAALGCIALIGVGAWFALASSRRKAAVKSNHGHGGNGYTAELDGASQHSSDMKYAQVQEDRSPREMMGHQQQYAYTMPMNELHEQTVVSELPDNGVMGPTGPLDKKKQW